MTAYLFERFILIISEVESDEQSTVYDMNAETFKEDRALAQVDVMQSK